MLNRYLAALLFIVVGVALILWLPRAGDPPETIIEFVPAAAPGCPKVPGRNPCAVINCNRGDTRKLT